MTAVRVLKTARAVTGYHDAFRRWVRQLRAQVDERKIAEAMHRGPNAVIAALGWPEKGDERAHDAAAGLHRELEAAHHATVRAAARRSLEGAVRKADKRDGWTRSTERGGAHWQLRRDGKLLASIDEVASGFHAYSNSGKDRAAPGLESLADAKRAAEGWFGRAAAAAADLSVPVDDKALSWARRRAGARMVDVTGTQVKSVRTIVERMLERGEHPNAIADTIRRVVGLTDLQADRVERRRALAIDQGASEERAAAVADKYADEIRDQRAEAIARTETKEAVEEGRLVGWREAVNQDLLPRSSQRKWIAFGTTAGRLCEICEQLDGQTVGLDEPFYSEVLQEHVDRPPAHPQCRCDQALVTGEED